MNAVFLGATGLAKMISRVIPDSHDVERRVDEIIGLTLGAFDSGLITEEEFREISAKCLNKLTYLAR